MVVQRPGFEPWNARVVTEPGCTVAAAPVVRLTETGTAHIARIGTRTDQRDRGLAEELLVDSFAAGREHGATVSELNTDSRTGALGRYEKVGMVVHSVRVDRSIELEPTAPPSPA